ncbi:hypothetical protein BDY19DRAFT_900664 [Irpex rosettiformis]|uniref:Uncharacterized protein n=1 Tax=Irpex rosettiformis TaxID=378272 RepID=A0ACB8TMF6_9APHY|nr:hypothetical protein BDY19DRAFT_900664 [Irpex rosettiformis]
MSSNATNTLATVLSSGPHKIPTLSSGEITIEVFMRWKDACEDYFEIKEIKEDKRVTHAGTRLQDLLVRDWYRSDAARLRALAWDDFAREFKTRWLPSDWDVKARNTLTRCRQTNEDNFKDWVVKIETLNAVLKDTASYKSESDLRNHIESLVCDRLAQLAISAATSSIVAYRDWREKMIILDNERLANAAEITRVSARAKGATQKNPPANNNSSSTSFGRFNNCEREHPPPLTENERALLFKYHGCFKCRRFFAGHRQRDCKNAPPKGVGYKELSEDDALKAKTESDRRKAPDASSKRNTTAAVGFDDDIDQNVSATVNSSPIATGVLSCGDTDDSECVPSFSLPHFMLRAFVHSSSGPLTHQPVRMLIDCGSSTVLMRSEVAKALSLRIRKLPAPLSLNSAWGSQGAQVTNWVKLRISLRSLAWTSHSVRCLIVDDLCAPVILGMPFLSHNNLIIDCNRRKVLDSNTGFDIINPSKGRASPASRASDTQPSIEPMVNTVAAIRSRIEELALADRLVKLEQETRDKFHDVFPAGTPRLSDLPTDVYHRFKLKDPNMVISRCNAITL